MTCRRREAIPIANPRSCNRIQRTKHSTPLALHLPGGLQLSHLVAADRTGLSFKSTMFRAPVRGAPGSALVLTQPSAGGGAGMPSPSTTSEAVPCTSGALPTPGGISGWGSWLPRDVRLMPSTAAATESSSELSVERAGAANEAFSIANSFRLAAPEGKGKRSRPGDLDLRGTHTLAYGFISYTLADLTCPKLPLTRYYPWEVIFTREAS